MAPTFIIFYIGDEIMLFYMRRHYTLLDQFERVLSSSSLHELFNALNDHPQCYIRIKPKTDGHDHGGYLLTDYDEDEGICQYIKVSNAWNNIRSFNTVEDTFVGHFNIYHHMFFRTRSVASSNDIYTNVSQQLNTIVFRKKMVAPIGSLRVKKFKGTYGPEED